MPFLFKRDENDQPSPQDHRMRMVRDQLQRRDITDEKVLQAFRKVPRHRFVPEEMKTRAYADYPLPIGEGQTISQPYIVAKMSQALKLKEGDKVLEIGTGSGYQTAILAELAGEIFTIERFETLSKGAKRVLEELGYEKIYYETGDGTVGWEEYAPYDKIIGTGSVPKVPASLLHQLKAPGRLVIPVGSRRIQELMLVKKQAWGQLEEEELCPCSFIALKGKEGW